jgi:multidrug efflux system outer membrane protein
MRKPILLSVVAVILAGCAVGPDYTRPSVETPQAWRYEAKEAQDVANTLWWEQFGDPVMNELILSALRENKDLMIAAARVEEYGGRLMVTRSDLFPQVTGSGTSSVNRVSEKGATPVPSSVSNPSKTYQGTFGSFWELDIWGRLRRADEAARADLLATEEVRRGMILTLCSSVASSYIILRDLDNQLLVAKRTAESRKETLNLFKTRSRGGVISDLELSQVMSQYAQALARIPAIERLISQQEDALSILLGKDPGPIARGKNIDELKFPAIPQGLPSDLLERRPDIRQAEQALIAANARIGEARALYYPNISLTGAFGWSSTHLSDLFTGPARVWTWGGSIDAPIFTGGAIKGQNKVAEAVQKEALFTYQKTIQNAFREVNDALMNQKQSRAQLDAQKMQVDALRDYARIARTRFDNGYTSYIEVLDSERSLFEAELAYSQTLDELFTDLVSIYMAMGGGWVSEADKMIAPQDRKDMQDRPK